MGLSIYVERLYKANVNDYDFIQLTNEKGEEVVEVPEWAKKLKSKMTLHYFDWKKYKEETGIDINDYEWRGTTYGEEEYSMNVWPKEYKKADMLDYVIGQDEEGKNIYDTDAYEAYRNAHMVVIDLHSVPTYDVDVIWEDEVGYQRKGLNKKFYEDYNAGKIGYFVWTKEELERYKEEYCDGEDAKEEFQRNIIDNFTDGECCAEFSW